MPGNVSATMFPRLRWPEKKLKAMQTSQILENYCAADIIILKLDILCFRRETCFPTEQFVIIPAESKALMIIQETEKSVFALNNLSFPKCPHIFS